MDTSEEQWAWVVGFAGHYKVSSHGRVMSFRKGRGSRNTLGQKLLATPLIKGYQNVNLKVGVVKVKKRVHRLVAEAFLPNPFGKEEVNHKDGNKLNCLLGNLEWATKVENMEHSWYEIRKGTRGVELTSELGEKKWFRCQNEAAKHLGVNRSTMGQAARTGSFKVKGYTVTRKESP